MHFSRSRSSRLARKFAGAFSLNRWENYCLLAIAALACLAVVAVKSDAGTTPIKPFMTASMYPSTTKTQLITPSTVASLEAKPRASEAGWRKRHAMIKRNANASTADVMLLGDSITQGWEFHSQWEAAFPNITAVNAGISSDRAEHIQWRVKDGLLGKARPKVVILLAGINNLALHDADRIAATQAATIRAIRIRSPQTKVLLMAVFPSGKTADHPRRAKIARLNQRLAKLADGQNVHFLDVGQRFLATDGSISPTIMFDYLHLTSRGYRIWAAGLAPKLREMLASDPQA